MNDARSCVLAMLILVTTCVLCSRGEAAILALAPTTNGANLHVVDVSTHNATVLEATSCCAVQSGTVAADIVNHRVFYLANDGGVATLYTFGYGTTASLNSVAVNTDRRITHLDYDAVRARLVGFVAEDDGSIDVATLSMSTGEVVTNAFGPTCCTLRAGISAYNANTSMLYAVGRRSSDTSDQLLSFRVKGGKLQGPNDPGDQNAYDLGGERVVQLVVDGSALYALSSSASSDTLRPALIAFTPTFALNAIGMGGNDCCFVLAGSSAIDHGQNALVALTRASSSGPFLIRSFSLSDGTVNVGGAVSAMGLFEDSAVLFDRIFANSFE